MKLDKKQVPQLIVLGVLLIVCIGFVAFQFSGGNAVAPAPVKQAGTPDAATNPANTDLQEAATALTPTGEQYVRRDPFQPVALPVDPTSVPPPEPNRQVATPNRPTPALSGHSVPPIGIGPYPLTNTNSQTLQIRPPVEEEKDPSFVLTGIVRGANNVAIIRVGQSGRYVVRQGQLVEGRYLVLRVTSDSATLTYKGRRIEIRLGGVKNAS